jgi:hypothetical protein
MSDKKISQLAASTTPLAGSEVLPVVQSGATKQVSVSNLTAGRAVSVGSLASTGAVSGTTGAFSGNVTLTNSEVILSNAFFIKSKLVAGTNVNLIGRNSSDEVAIDPDSFGARIGSAGRYVFPSSGNLTIGLGNLVIGTAGKGIDFSADANATGMTSELLNDYEEGTWTPVIGGEGGESGQSYTAQRGRYTKVGRMVTCTLDVVLATKGTITGEVAVKGLPFTANSSADFSFPSMSVGLWQNFVTSFVYVAGIVINNSTRANLRAATAAATSLSALATADIANNTRVSGTITYFV